MAQRVAHAVQRAIILSGQSLAGVLIPLVGAFIRALNIGGGFLRQNAGLVRQGRRAARRRAAARSITRARFGVIGRRVDTIAEWLSRSVAHVATAVVQTTRPKSTQTIRHGLHLLHGGHAEDGKAVADNLPDLRGQKSLAPVSVRFRTR
jgi:hypothetical protein